jgi:peptidyl-prolyl cis-trans isomerase B (cyclophilin B)
MYRRFFISLLALVLVGVACGDDDTTETSAATEAGRTAATADTISTVEYQAFRAQPVACDAAAPAPALDMTFSQPDDVGLSGVVTAVVATSCGDITIELNAEVAPAAVNSFVHLAEQGYFDGTVSHRIVAGFMIQAGDPSATGRGGPGYLLPDELPANGFIYSRGTVAMANAGANTGGSQFFMMLADAPLPPAYSVFGTVTSGLEVLDTIATIPTIARATGQEPSSPTETVYIESVDIQR